MPEQKPSMFMGIVRMKCPHCGKGNIFVNRSVFPLGKMLATHEKCTECGETLQHKSNDAPGMNYAVTVIVYILCFVLYAVIFGLSWQDNSMYYALTASTLLVVLLQPWLMRISKVLYLYILTRVKFE